MKQWCSICSCTRVVLVNRTYGLQLRVNGGANVTVVRASRSAGVQRFVFISAVQSNLPSFVLPGYFQGKAQAGTP
jgi:hypothetical protein